MGGCVGAFCFLQCWISKDLRHARHALYHWATLLVLISFPRNFCLFSVSHILPGTTCWWWSRTREAEKTQGREKNPSFDWLKLTPAHGHGENKTTLLLILMLAFRFLAARHLVLPALKWRNLTAPSWEHTAPTLPEAMTAQGSWAAIELRLAPNLRAGSTGRFLTVLVIQKQTIKSKRKQSNIPNVVFQKDNVLK